jgi:hypothetical protein
VLLLTALLSVALILVNTRGSNCKDLGEDWICKISIANLAGDPKAEHLLQFGTLVTGLVSIGLMFIIEQIRSHEYKKARSYDSLLPLESSYSVLVRGLSPESAVPDLLYRLECPLEALRKVVPIHSLRLFTHVL